MTSAGQLGSDTVNPDLVAGVSADPSCCSQLGRRVRRKEGHLTIQSEVHKLRKHWRERKKGKRKIMGFWKSSRRVGRGDQSQAVERPRIDVSPKPDLQGAADFPLTASSAVLRHSWG